MRKLAENALEGGMSIAKWEDERTRPQQQRDEIDAYVYGAPGCQWSGGTCLTRASLKRTVHEMQEAVYAKGLSERALEMAERRYHQALTELMEHNCGEHDSAPDGVRVTGRGVATASRQDGPTSPPLSPPDIAEFENLIDRVCSLYARKAMPDTMAEYRDARLVLRTRILMLIAERTPRLLDILEANERGSR